MRFLLTSIQYCYIPYSEQLPIPWVHQGIGCTGVLNFDQIEEMKDRATERIDSALIANWKLHNVITQEDIEDAVRETAGIVDEQNANNPAHIAMTDT